MNESKEINFNDTINRIGKIDPLTSLRFFAALLVFIWHCGLFSKYELGYVGVSFFFVLSGFIITYIYHSKFTEINYQNVVSFYIARLAKIYPVHLLTFVLTIPLLIIEAANYGPPLRVLRVGLLNIFLLQSYISGIHFSFNGVSWSLSDEMFFYALFPFVLFYMLKNKKIFSGYKALLTMALFWTILVVILIQFPSVKLDNWQFYIFPAWRISDFIFGIITGLIFLEKSRETKISTNKSTILEFISLVVVFTALFFGPYVNQSLRFSVYYLPIWSFLIYIFAFQNGFLSRILSFKILVFLGEISFSFYMVHQLVIRYFSFVHFLNHGLIKLAVSLFLGSLIYLFFEEPARKYIRQKSPVKSIRKFVHNKKAPA